MAKTKKNSRESSVNSDRSEKPVIATPPTMEAIDELPTQTFVPRTAKRKSVQTSTKAGIIMPASRIKRKLKADNYARKVGIGKDFFP